MATVASVLELGGMEADLKQVGSVLLGKSHRDFISPALLKSRLAGTNPLIAVIYCVGFRQDDSADAHRCMAMLNDNGTLGQNLSFPTFLPPARLLYLM